MLTSISLIYCTYMYNSSWFGFPPAALNAELGPTACLTLASFHKAGDLRGCHSWLVYCVTTRWLCRCHLDRGLTDGYIHVYTA